MKKIKILTITTSGLNKKEGISTVILDYYSFFDKNKFQLDLVASGEYNHKLIKEFENIDVGIKYLPSRKRQMLQYIKALTCLLREEDYDAIYVHGSSAIMSIELVIARICGCKIRVVHSHNTTCDHRKLDIILRPLFYKSYTVALACGVDAGKWLYGNRNFQIVKNGRDTDKYKYNKNKRYEMREKLNITDDVIAIGHVGNFNRQKNQEYLIELMAKLHEKNKNIKMYLMGDGITKQSMLEKVKNRKLEDSICFTGSIDNVPDMLQAMDIMVLPSLYEGLPLVVVEWQISGLRCLVSDAVTKECSYTELVEFLPLNNINLWEEKIIELLKYDRELESETAISSAREHGFDLKINANELQEYFVIKYNSSKNIR